VCLCVVCVWCVHVYTFVLRTGMRDKASEVRAAAATTAGVLARDTGNPAIIASLIDLFEDSDGTVRSSALSVYVLCTTICICVHLVHA